MLLKLNYALFLLLLTSSAVLAQSRTMYIGGVELRLGMAQDAVMKALTAKYKVSADGSNSFFVTEYDERSKLHNYLGSIGFDNNQLTGISRSIDTSGWPDDEGYAVARAIYEAIDSSIPLTDRDGTKRADVKIVIYSQDTSRPRGTVRNMDIYINQRRITILVGDGADGRSVSAEMAIRATPWQSCSAAANNSFNPTALSLSLINIFWFHWRRRWRRAAG